MTKKKLPVFCREFFDYVKANPTHFGRKAVAQCERVKRVFETEDLIVYEDRYEDYIGLGKYLGFGRGFEWERFVIGCSLCTYNADNTPRWDDFFVCMGRGGGKDGLISWISECLISPYNPAKDYDVDIAGVGEEQALRPVNDLYQVMKNDKPFFSHFFKWSIEKITGLENGGTIKGHANNPKSKDGLRSGAVIFNEVHAYETNAQIDVFVSGLGKKDDSRTFYFTTNGNVVGGPFDDKMEAATELLDHPEEPDDGFFYLIFELDDKSEVDNEDAWHKANPSLIYKPALLREMRKEYKIWKRNPAALPAFMTKRMNLRQTATELPAAEWEDIQSTDRPIPYEKLRGQSCICGIDFAQTTDWAGVNLHFVDEDGTRYDINHGFVCLQSRQNWRLKCPYREWADAGELTLVDAPEISPELITGWIRKQSALYCIDMIVLDSYRYELMRKSLEEIGFSVDDKTVKLYRPSDIMRTVPLITSAFANRSFVWGSDAHALRWATNNTKLVPAKRSKLAADGEIEMGNYLYGKIEPQARKTDLFMALVASMTEERSLIPICTRSRARIGVVTY